MAFFTVLLIYHAQLTSTQESHKYFKVTEGAFEKSEKNLKPWIFHFPHACLSNSQYLSAHKAKWQLALKTSFSQTLIGQTRSESIKASKGTVSSVDTGEALTVLMFRQHRNTLAEHNKMFTTDINQQ